MSDVSVPIERAGDLHAEALALARAGRYADAVPLLIEALQIRLLLLGAGHASFLASLINLGRAWLETGEFDRAWRVLIEGLERAYAAGSPQGVVLDTLGQLHHELQHPDLAVAYYLRAHTLHGREQPKGSPYPLRTLSNAALVCLDFGAPFEHAAELAWDFVERLRAAGDTVTANSVEATLTVASNWRALDQPPAKVLASLSPEQLEQLSRYRPDRDGERIRWLVDAVAGDADAMMHATASEIDEVVAAEGLGERIQHEHGSWTVTDARGYFRHQLFVFGPRTLAVTTFPQFPVISEELDPTAACNLAWNLFDSLKIAHEDLALADIRFIGPFYPDLGHAIFGVTGLLRLGINDGPSDIRKIFKRWATMADMATLAALRLTEQDWWRNQTTQDPSLRYLPPYLWP